MLRWWIMAVTFIVATGFTASALAQEEGNTIFKRKTVINFEDDTIEGDLKTPDAEYLEARKKMRHASLIKIRDNFRRRVLQSVGEL